VTTIFAGHNFIIIYSGPDRGAEYGDERVCLYLSVCVCVCVSLSVRDHIFGTAPPIFTIFLCTLPVAVARSSSGGELMYLCTLCTSGFMDDVIFAHKPKLLDVAAKLTRCAHAALGLAINCRPTEARDYFSGAYNNCLGGNTGGESAVYDCLVCCNLQDARKQCE